MSVSLSEGIDSHPFDTSKDSIVRVYRWSPLCEAVSVAQISCPKREGHSIVIGIGALSNYEETLKLLNPAEWRCPVVIDHSVTQLEEPFIHKVPSSAHK